MSGNNTPRFNQSFESIHPKRVREWWNCVERRQIEKRFRIPQKVFFVEENNFLTSNKQVGLTESQLNACSIMMHEIQWVRCCLNLTHVAVCILQERAAGQAMSFKAHLTSPSLKARPKARQRELARTWRIMESVTRVFGHETTKRLLYILCYLQSPSIQNGRWRFVAASCTESTLFSKKIKVCCICLDRPQKKSTIRMSSPVDNIAVE